MIIVTGGAGFIGSVLLSTLNQAGYKELIVVDNLHSSDKWKNLRGKIFRDYWPREKLLSAVQSNNLPEKIEAIIHLGACSSTFERNVDFLMENNFRYTVALAEYCTRNEIRFIYASSGATYGDGKLGFSDSTSSAHLRPLNPYGFSKQLFDMWAEQNGLIREIVGVKFFNVFGPNEYHKGPMQSMVLKGYEQVVTSKKLRLFKSNTPQFKDGEQKRDFIYVKDCCDALLWLLQNPKVAGLYNLGRGKAETWNDLARALFEAAKIPYNVEYIEMPSELSRQYQNFTLAEMNKLRSVGYSKEFMSLTEAVHDYVSRYLATEERFL